MQFSLNNLKPYAETMRAWLVNLSVASMAVGLFNGVLFEVVYWRRAAYFSICCRLLA